MFEVFQLGLFLPFSSVLCTSLTGMSRLLSHMSFVLSVRVMEDFQWLHSDGVVCISSRAVSSSSIYLVHLKVEPFWSITSDRWVKILDNWIKFHVVLFNTVHFSYLTNALHLYIFYSLPATARSSSQQAWSKFSAHTLCTDVWHLLKRLTHFWIFLQQLADLYDRWVKILDNWIKFHVGLFNLVHFSCLTYALHLYIFYRYKKSVHWDG